MKLRLRQASIAAAGPYVDRAVCARGLLAKMRRGVTIANYLATPSYDRSFLGRSPLSFSETVAHRAEHVASTALLMPFVAGALHLLYPDQQWPAMDEWRLIARRYFYLLERDQRNIGTTYPRDVVRSSHADLDYASHREAVHVLMRRIVSRADAQEHWHIAPQVMAADVPRYFTQLFHWMGWHDPEVGLAWDYLTELLFFGVYGVIQRQAIAPAVDHLRTLTRVGQITELGAGTGQLAQLMIRTLRWHRLTCEYTCNELSPQMMRAAAARLRGDEEVALLQTNAETLNLPDASQDVVLIINLLHELPADARERVAQTAARILRPGGKAVVIDATQHDRLASFRGNFDGYLHEPYYRSYQREPVAALFARAGLRSNGRPSPLFLADRWVFTRPA